MKITIERTELLQHALIGFEAQRADVERRMAAIRLQLNGAAETNEAAPKAKRRRRRKISPEGRARIIAATKLRWEKWRKARRAKKK
jgi:hypothetical protein